MNETSGVKLLDFWAAWCGPCKIMNPIIEELEKEFAGKITVEKYDVDAAENQAVVQQYQVMAMPTYFVVKGDQVVEHIVGATGKAKLTAAIEKALG